MSSPSCDIIREGIPFLRPGERIRCVWDHIDRLVPYLREKRLYEGMAVKVRYKDLPGEAYTTEWRINPLLYEGLRYDASQLPQLAPGLLPEKIPADAKSDKTSDSQRGVRDEDGGQND